MSADFNSLQKDFKGESKDKKVILGSAAVMFVSVFLPWVSIGNGYYSHSVSGMQGMGVFSMIAAAAILALWVLPKMDVKLPVEGEQKKNALKALTIVMAIPAVYYFIQMITHGGISMIGFGLWIAVAASAMAIYTVFVGCPSKKCTGSKCNEDEKEEKIETPKNTQ